MRAFTANLVVGLFLLALRAPAAVAGYEQEVLADKPFVYYRFEETGGTLAADSSGNGHDAEYVDGVDLQQPSAEDVVANDLTVIGSLDGGGGLGDVDLVYIPEPSTVALLVLGLAGTLATRRRKSS